MSLDLVIIDQYVQTHVLTNNLTIIYYLLGIYLLEYLSMI